MAGLTAMRIILADGRLGSPVDLKRVTGIYHIHCSITRRNYVGQSIQMHNRYFAHRAGLRNDNHSNPHLLASFRKYGEQAHTFRVVIAGGFSKQMLNNLEWWYFRELNGLNELGGFNLAPVGGNRAGQTNRAEINRRISEGLKGKTKSPETRAAISQAKRGRKLTEAHLTALKSAGAKRRGSPRPADVVKKYTDNRWNGRCAYRSIVEINGVQKSVADWLNHNNINQHTFGQRLKRGWSVEDAITRPMDADYRLITIDGETHSLSEWSRRHKIPMKTASNRLSNGWDVRQALTTPLKPDRRRKVLAA